MQNPKDEDYYLLIPNPIDGKKEEFELGSRGNVGLVLRLIRKRERLTRSSRDNFDRIKSLRSKHNISDVEDRINELTKEVGNLYEDDFEDKESYQEREQELYDELKELQESFPDELLDLQNNTAKTMRDIDRVGVKICAILLQPVNGVPDEYDSKKDYIEEFIADDQDVQDVISFFLSTLNSTTRSHKDTGIEMKSRTEEKKNKKE